MSNLELSVDMQAQAAYITLRHEVVVSTRSVTEAVLVDLDAMNVVVGVEILSLSAPIPFTELHTQFHVHSDTIDALRLIQPSIKGFLSQASDGIFSKVSQLESVPT